MNKENCRRIVREVLHDMDRHSGQAELAIMMIIAHESFEGNYWFQIGGPALGVIQMEPVTHDSVWDFGDTVHANAKKLGLVRDVTQLYKSLEYNIFMARQRLLMDVNPFPKHARELSIYLKEYWNAGGRAGDLDYYTAYQRWLDFDFIV